MKFLLSVSNSGGHIYPALALEKYLRSQGEKCTFLILDKKPSNDLITRDCYTIKANSFKQLRREDLLTINKAVKEADVVVGFGGFVSFLGSAYGFFRGKKCYLFEANTTLGAANRYSLPFVKKVFTYFPLKGRKVEEIGTPREDEFFSVKLRPEASRILLLAGSLGSETLAFKYRDLASANPSLRFTMSLGVRAKKIENLPANLKTVTYLAAKSYTDYDLIVMRAGATTISEMNKLGLPYILIPSPYVKNDHQRKNALFMKDYGIETVEESDSIDKLSQAIRHLLPYERRIEVQKKIQTCAHQDVLKTAYTRMVQA